MIGRSASDPLGTLFDRARVIRTPMTRDGHRKLLQRRDLLVRSLREAGERAGDAAGINRDWHDNAGYEQAVQEMGVLQTQLDDVEVQLGTAEIIELTVAAEVVEIGSRVTVEIEGSEESYLIGGEADSDPARGIISHRSPIGAALLGRRPGDEVEAATPSGATVNLRVLAIGE